MEPHCQELEPSVTDLQNDPNILDSAQKNPTQVVFENLYLPIALRKGVRSCTMHPYPTLSHIKVYLLLFEPLLLTFLMLRFRGLYRRP